MGKGNNWQQFRFFRYFQKNKRNIIFELSFKSGMSFFPRNSMDYPCFCVAIALTHSCARPLDAFLLFYPEPTGKHHDRIKNHHNECNEPLVEKWSLKRPILQG